MHIERTLRKTRSVPMTPLVDVVFLLLVFFMLSTSFVRSRSLELMLPQADGSPSVRNAESEIIQVFVASDGSIFMGEEQVNEEQLVAQLKAKVAEDANTAIILLNGPDVAVQQLVSTVDHIYIAGVSNLSVASWKPEVIETQPVMVIGDSQKLSTPPSDEVDYGN